MSDSALFETIELSKHYPGVIANDAVSLSIAPGSIHALLGENGAGKSTLVKMIYGVVRPSSGEMRFRGEPYLAEKPQIARAKGIGMVFQHFSLFNALTVAENIEIGMENPPRRAALAAQIRALSADYGLPLEPDQIVGQLSAGERQRVEIIRCLLQSPKLLIMDEPTSVLTPAEVESLFHTLRKLRDDGVSILYISHKLDEIRVLCDHATILRRGRVVGDVDPRTQTARQLAELMVGEVIAKPRARKAPIGDEILRIDAVSMEAQGLFGAGLKAIDLRLRRGEILGIAGVAGNGQEEFLSMMTGEARIGAGAIVLEGNDIHHLGVVARRELGLIGVPEERNGHAAVPALDLTRNAVMTAQNRMQLSNGPWIDWGKAHQFADEVIAAFDVRTPGAHVLAGALSGGNLQKFIMGRELLQSPSLLVVNQPTWGVDVSAAAFIRDAIRARADEGAGVIVISQDLDEIYELSDSVAALCEGRLSPKYAADEIDAQALGELMGGAF